GAAGLAEPSTARRRRRVAYATRTAQLHRRLAYAHPLALPFVWLAILPLAVLRSIFHFAEKTPGLIGPEWAAATVAVLRFGAIARSRRRIGRWRRASWARIRELRIDRVGLRRRFDTTDADAAGHVPTELHFFAGGGAWAVLGALVASVAVFTPLLAWPVLGGGGLFPLPDSVAQLWREAGWGQRASGIATVGPADPFAALLAVVGSLWPARPSSALVALWVLALPLAVLGGWFATTRLTGRSVLRIAGGVGWALSPTFLAALQQGRPAAVLAHLLLPWLFWAGAVAHRSWTTAGAASLLFAGVAAAAPSLTPALLVLWVLAIVLAAVSRAGHGVMRLVWIVVPAAALALPLVWRQLRAANPLGLLADPGPVWSGPQVAADAAGRAMLALGFPTDDLGGWTSLLDPDAPTWWVPLLLAPFAVLAVLAPLSRRWAAGWVLVAIALLGVGTAFAAVGIAVSGAQAEAVALWPGTGLSLAWLGVVGAAVTTLDAGLLAPRASSLPGLGERIVRPVAVGVALVALGVLSAPALSAVHRGESLLTDGPRSTLPAYVAAEGRTDPDVGTLVITPQPGGGVSSRVVWGPSETLDGQSALLATRRAPSAADEELAELTADLVASSAPGVVEELIGDGVSFVLLAPAAEPESERARATRIKAVTAIDQREQLVAVGETSSGLLWRAVATPEARAGLSAGQRSTAGWIAASQIAVFVIAVLLAVPTSGSRRAARTSPRTVGAMAGDGS
ncbi:MAG: glycosyl transferase, partial [Microbacterium sp.]